MEVGADSLRAKFPVLPTILRGPLLFQFLDSLMLKFDNYDITGLDLGPGPGLDPGLGPGPGTGLHTSQLQCVSTKCRQCTAAPHSLTHTRVRGERSTARDPTDQTRAVAQETEDAKLCVGLAV